MTDTTTENTEEPQSEDKPLREMMPDEVDERALQRWIRDFLYESPPEPEWEYKGISWVDNED